MPCLLKRHPLPHRKNAKMYFIPNTIKLHPEYQHLAQSFAPLLQNTHNAHKTYTNIFPHIAQFIQLQLQNTHHPSHLLYAIIITLHPSLKECNRILSIQNPCPTNWTITLLEKLNTLNNSPERHIQNIQNIYIKNYLTKIKN